MYTKEQIENHSVFEAMRITHTQCLRITKRVKGNLKVLEYIVLIIDISTQYFSIIPENLLDENSFKIFDRIEDIFFQINNLLIQVKHQSAFRDKDNYEIYSLLIKLTTFLNNSIGDIYLSNEGNTQISSRKIDIFRNESLLLRSKLQAIHEELTELLNPLYPSSPNIDDKKPEEYKKKVENIFQKIELELENKKRVLREKSLTYEKRYEEFIQTLNDKFLEFKQSKVNELNIENEHSFKLFKKNKDEEIASFKERKEEEFLSFQKIKEKELEDYKQKVEESLRQMEEKFKNKKSALNESFKKYQEELSFSLEKTQYETEETLHFLNATEEGIKKLTTIITNTSLASRYSQIANTNTIWARITRCIAVIIMFATIGVSLYFKDFFLKDANLFKMLIKASMLFLFLTPAAYLARIGASYKTVAEHATNMELELTALTPYLSSFDDEEANKLKRELAFKFFGNKKEEEELLSKKDLKKFMFDFLRKHTELKESKS